jgi:hypothetical protein
MSRSHISLTVHPTPLISTAPTPNAAINARSGIVAAGAARLMLQAPGQNNRTLPARQALAYHERASHGGARFTDGLFHAAQLQVGHHSRWAARHPIFRHGTHALSVRRCRARVQPVHCRGRSAPARDGQGRTRCSEARGPRPNGTDGQPTRRRTGGWQPTSTPRERQGRRGCERHGVAP